MKLLADSLRPTNLCDYLGQSHILGKGKPLRNLLENKKLFSIILYGTPGCGKTTLANIIANEINKPSFMLNAATNNKDDFLNAIRNCQMSSDGILIIDEIHRMNKDKQDILLPYLENGTVILIGLTTSNPYIKVNPAIRSRCMIFELKELTKEEINDGLNKACKMLENIKIDKKALEYIASLSCGDIRYAYNLLEMVYYAKEDHKISLKDIEEMSSKPNIYIDGSEQAHYDMLSALQKSIRGSDPNAAIFYLARLLIAGDLDSIERRLSVIAYEDIGLANPGIGPRLDSAINAAERVGLPEAEIIFANIVIEMALSPKSNSTYMALAKAKNDINEGLGSKIPSNITTSSKEYLYPHNYQKSYVKQQYLPDDLKDRKYYIPKNNNVENNLNKVYEDMKK